MKRAVDAQPSAKPMSLQSTLPTSTDRPGHTNKHDTSLQWPYTVIRQDWVSAAGQVGAARSFAVRYRYAKRVLDLFGAAIGLIIFAPVIAALALIVRLESDGPAFFVQIRIGQHGKPFRIFKLRTMRVPRTSIDTALADDAERITRFGGYLRRWSLDELPQLFNVLRGEMSLVGPRPERPDIVLTRYERWQYARFAVPQGLTGWWQIAARGHTRLCDDTTSDLLYLERASFWFDLSILVRTLPAVIRQAGQR